MAAGAGKKGSTSLSLFLEAYGYHGHASLGRRNLYWQVACRAKRSVEDAEF